MSNLHGMKQGFLSTLLSLLHLLAKDNVCTFQGRAITPHGPSHPKNFHSSTQANVEHQHLIQPLSRAGDAHPSHPTSSLRLLVASAALSTSEGLYPSLVEPECELSSSSCIQNQMSRCQSVSKLLLNADKQPALGPEQLEGGSRWEGKI